MTPYAFTPSAPRTRAVSLAVRSALADSVDRVLAVVGRFGVVWTGDLQAWRKALLATETPPYLLWAVYHDLVQAVVREDLAAVAALADDLLLRLPSALAKPSTVVTLSPADLGADAARVAAIIDSDEGRHLGLVPVPPTETARIAGLAADARPLLAETCPDLLDEIDTMGRTIILATGTDTGFGGAATVFLWGAVALNPTFSRSRIDMVEALAHETAHALLFGMTTGADLTTNGPDARYGSPLRPDPRPIEGIVHATYVLARMTFALEQIRRSARLTVGEEAEIARKIADNRRNYAAGLETVTRHARFTEAGRIIFGECVRAMDGQDAGSSVPVARS